MSGTAATATPKDHPRVPVDEVVRCLRADHPGPASMPSERRSPASEIVGVGGENLEDIELEQLNRTPLRRPAEIPAGHPRQSAGSTPSRRMLDLREIRITPGSAPGAQSAADVVLQQPLDELIRTGRDLGVRKLQQDDPVAVQFAQERHLVPASAARRCRATAVLRPPCRMQRYASLPQRNRKSLNAFSMVLRVFS